MRFSTKVVNDVPTNSQLLDQRTVNAEDFLRDVRYELTNAQCERFSELLRSTGDAHRAVVELLFPTGMRTGRALPTASQRKITKRSR